VLSDPVGEKVRFLADARAAGYFVVVHCVGLASAAQSRVRVFQRVQEGGHDVPDEKLAARYARVLENLARLLDVPDDLTIDDNSSSAEPYRLVAVLSRGALSKVTRSIPAWAAFLNLPTRITPATEILP
jgi:predicted ABC-type ATPase